MNIYAIVEPLVQDKYWSNQYTQGIKHEVQKTKGKYFEITFEQLQDVIDYSKNSRLRAVVLLNCISNTWIPESISKLESYGIHPLLLTPITQMITPAVSTISLDFYNIFYSLCRYLEQVNRMNIALFGLNPISSNDIEKKRAFTDYCATSFEEIEKRIFWNYGELDDCCNSFFEQISNFNAVICANDVIAIKLITFLKHKNIAIPHDIYVATMGNTQISKIITPQVTVAEFDCYTIGQQAAKVYAFLAKNRDISYLTATVSGRIIPRESTDGIAATKINITENKTKMDVDFYADNDVKTILALENLFKGIDKLDWNIIRCILSDKKATAVAQELFISENTLKYRLKRMYTLVGCDSKSSFLKLLKQYVDIVNLVY